MSDIAITIQAWPFLVAAGVGALFAGLLLGWARRRSGSGWGRWLAGGLGLIAALAALALGILGLLLAAGA